MSSLSSCTNHPTTEAVGRCKQCGKPFCGQCRVQGPTGYFCSDACNQNHQAFVARAQKLDDMKASGQWGKRIKNLAMGLVVLGIASVIAHYFGFDIPVIGGFLEGVVPRGN